MITPKEVRVYRRPHGAAPFDQWLASLKDAKGTRTVLRRNRRITLGNCGGCQVVGGGVYELRIHFGPGYRIYFGQTGDTLFILCGGDKSTQTRDIQIAQSYWVNYRMSHL